MWKLTNPATGEVFRTLKPTTDNELNRILELMRVAQRDWRETRIDERGRICGQFLEAFRLGTEGTALDITRQMGKPVTQARREVDRMLERAETMVGLARESLADEALPPKEGFRRFIRH